jgi:hypothetical protein
MATIKTAVDIDIKVDGQATVQQAAAAYEDLGDAVAKTQLEAEKLAQQFGINDARTQEAIRVAGAYKGQLEQLDFAIEAAKGGSDQLFRATQGVLGGFEAAAGAAALFGFQSEDLEASLIKLQGAMALSQGLKDFNEFLPAIKQVGTAIKTQLVTAFSTLRGAIAATGVGALVVGIGLLVEKMLSLKDATNEASDAQKAYNKELRDLNIERIALTKGELAALKIQRDAAIAEQKRNNEYIKSWNERFKIIKEAEQLDVDLADSNDRRRSAEAKKRSLDNVRLTNEILKFNARIKAIEEQAQKDKEKTQTKAVNTTKEKLQEEVDIYEWYLGEIQSIFNDLGQDIAETTQTTIVNATAQIDIPLGYTFSRLEKTKAFVKAYAADIADTLQQALEASAAIADAFAGADEERQKKAFELTKKAAVASTIISTIEGTQNAFTEAQKNPLNEATFGAYAVTRAAIALAFGLAQVQKIRSSQFQGSTPTLSGTSSTGIPRVQTQQFQTSQLGQDFTGQTKVYVTEGDITRTINRRQTNQRVSVIGG